MSRPNHGPRRISELLPLVILYRWNLQPAGPDVLPSIRRFRRAVASGNPARIARVLASVDKRARAKARGGRRERQHAASVSSTVQAAAPRSSLGLETDRVRLPPPQGSCSRRSQVRAGPTGFSRDPSLPSVRVRSDRPGRHWRVHLDPEQ